MPTIFRPYPSSEAERSDRSAGDRLRHRQKVRQAIRENIADIVAEESIIGQSRDRIIKVPIRGIREYRFVYGSNQSGVGTGDGDAQPGQKVGKGDGDGKQQGPGPAGDQPGVDYYETDVSLEELIDIMFEDLELPEMERKRLRQTMAERISRRKGYRKVGIRVHLDKKRTAIQRIRRRKASRHDHGTDDDDARFPFHRDDVKYRRMMPKPQLQSNAVVLCIMDTSASMDTVKKYLARSFFFLLYQFVRTRYQNVEVVFIAHDVAAREVSEQEFFSKGESGGTMISSGYRKALDVIGDRYHPTLWNIYAFHCSDGDNWGEDDASAVKAALELCEVANLFGYGEIKPRQTMYVQSSMYKTYEKIKVPNFEKLVIHKKEDIWPGFKKLLRHDSAATAETAAEA
ncbi:MAG: hypothetical protein CMJ18_27575 [Phycisphaeraceae bacterium]|nr:hypothetical protein [Phycisphaeraceae bacterium]